MLDEIRDIEVRTATETMGRGSDRYSKNRSGRRNKHDLQRGGQEQRRVQRRDEETTDGTPKKSRSGESGSEREKRRNRMI